MPSINRETVSGEALYILKSLRENGEKQRSNKLADVKAALEPSVSLEFDSYFFFLRKFHYIAMDREAQLKLTDQGDKVVDGGALDKFAGEVGEFFAAQLEAGEVPEKEEASDAPSSSTHTDLSFEDDAPAAEAPSPRSGKKGKGPPPPPQSSRRGDDTSGGTEASSASSSSTSSTSSSKGSELDSRFTKHDELGAGPLGTVFKGRHNALGLDVAVKEMKDIFGYFQFLQRGEVIKRLKRELCAQAQVRHPGVVAVLDQNTDVARPFYVTELMSGSLRERLDQADGKGLPVGKALRYFLQISYALRASHAQGLTHLNIKPENVLFDAYGNAKLSDFGLGRVIEVDQSKGMPQVFVGTGGMAYLAPEAMSRPSDAGPAADVYAAGILLYEMLTGQIPGRRSALPSEVNSEVPSKLDPIFDKMAQDRIDGRYPDIESMLGDFYGAFSDGEYLSKGDLVLWSDTD